MPSGLNQRHLNKRRLNKKAVTVSCDGLLVLTSSAKFFNYLAAGAAGATGA